MYIIHTPEKKMASLFEISILQRSEKNDYGLHKNNEQHNCFQLKKINKYTFIYIKMVAFGKNITKTNKNAPNI